MNDPAPLEALFDRSRGPALPLPPRLAKVYGSLRIPRPRGRPYVVGNFAATLDGVVSLQIGGRSGGGEITGFDPHDRLLMGLLRALADAVIVGAGTLRAVPKHRWTAQHVYPSHAAEFAELRRSLGKPPFPLNVIVTGEGKLDLRLPVFTANPAKVLIVTGGRGRRRISDADLPEHVRVATVRGSGTVSADGIIRAVRAAGTGGCFLVEGGPHLIGEFLAAARLDELFLTVAPQVAGRNDDSQRPGLVAGRLFAPDRPLWGSLVGVRRGGSTLFLRYAFQRVPGSTGRLAPSAGHRASPH